MKAPHKEALLKALEQIIETATASLDARAPSPELHIEILREGHLHIRAIARTARGDRRWGRRPSMTPLPPEDGA